MKYNGLTLTENFLEFMEKGFQKVNGKMHPMSSYISIFQNISKYFELNYKSYEYEKDLVSPYLEDLNIKQITAEDFRVSNYFKNIYMCIICPLVNESIFLRYTKDEEKEDEYKIDIEAYDGVICSNAIANLCFKDNPGGVYTKDILFIRPTGREDGLPVFIYKESRFHIYNSNLIDMNYDDIALDRKVCYKYMSSVIKSLNKEIYDNMGDFLLLSADEIN